MYKIGAFSKLSLTTVKALRFYEKEGLLAPATVDEWTGYRYYETAQLETAARIKAYRQLGLSVEEIKAIFAGADARQILSRKADALKAQQSDIEIRLSIIRHFLEEKEMKYQVTVKDIPEQIVYYAEQKLAHISDIMQFVPQCGEAARKLNPDLQCSEPPYEFCEYLDGDYKETDVLVRHSESVTAFGKEDDFIRFRHLPAAKVLSIYHKGAYEQLGEAYTYILRYAQENGYKCVGLARERYIDGIWNKDSVEDWLTEIQLPIA